MVIPQITDPVPPSLMGETHSLAAAFVYGREAITPSMLMPLVQGLNKQFTPTDQALTTTLRYYLQRHIELDDQNHFPNAVQMLKNLAGEDQQKWIKINQNAQKALIARLDFLTAIADTIKFN